MTTLSRRSKRDEQPDEDTPRRSRRRTDEPEEDRPRRGRATRSSRSSREDDRPTRRSRRSRDDDEPDEGRSRSRRKRGTPAKGWDAYASKRKTNSNFAEEFKPYERPDHEHVIKFLDDGPFDNYDRHWIDETKKGVKKSYVCPDGDDCPLCAIGDPPTTFSVFNIVDLTAKRPTNMVWNTSVSITDLIQRHADSERSSPLNRDDLYFVVTVTKKKKRNVTDIEPLKERDLKEDFDIDPLTDEELEEFDEGKFEDYTVVTQPDSAEDLEDLIEEYGLDD
jgi:hypothetical protein